MEKALRNHSISSSAPMFFYVSMVMRNFLMSFFLITIPYIAPYHVRIIFTTRSLFTQFLGVYEIAILLRRLLDYTRPSSSRSLDL